MKYDAACHPTLSFQDRLLAVALNKAREFGMQTVGCLAGTSPTRWRRAAMAGPRRDPVPGDLEAAKLVSSAVYGATLVGVRGN